MHRPFPLATFAALAFALIGPGAAVAATVPAEPVVLAPIAAFVKASNAGDRAGLIALFTPDAGVVDEFAPYRFPAPSAAAHWYDGFAADSAAKHEESGVIVAHPPSGFHVTGAHAWASIPLDYRYTRAGKAQLETGALVFTLREVAGTWKIASMSWAKLSDTAVPAGSVAVPPALRAVFENFARSDNGGNRAALIADFTADAVLVDEFTTYRFAAPGAAGAWYDAAGADSTANQTSDGGSTFAAPSFAGITGGRAWLVFPARYSFVQRGMLTVEHGSAVVTARTTPAGWKLTTLTWALHSVTRTPKKT